MFSKLFIDYKKAQKSAADKAAEPAKKTPESEGIKPDYRNVVESFFKTPQGIEFALTYGLLKVSDIAAMRKDFSKENDTQLTDVVIQGIILLKSDGSLYRVANEQIKKFPTVVTVQEFDELTGGDYSAKVRMSRNIADSLLK